MAESLAWIKLFLYYTPNLDRRAADGADDEDDADRSHGGGAEDRHEARKGVAARNALEQLRRRHDGHADGDQHGREADAERRNQQQAVRHAVQRNRGQKHDERRWTGNDAARDTQRDQRLRRDWPFGDAVIMGTLPRPMRMPPIMAVRMIMVVVIIVRMPMVMRVAVIVRMIVSMPVMTMSMGDIV